MKINELLENVVNFEFRNLDGWKKHRTETLMHGPFKVKVYYIGYSSIDDEYNNVVKKVLKSFDRKAKETEFATYTLTIKDTLELEHLSIALNGELNPEGDWEEWEWEVEVTA